MSVMHSQVNFDTEHLLAGLLIKSLMCFSKCILKPYPQFVYCSLGWAAQVCKCSAECGTTSLLVAGTIVEVLQAFSNAAAGQL